VGLVSPAFFLGNEGLDSPPIPLGRALSWPPAAALQPASRGASKAGAVNDSSLFMDVINRHPEREGHFLYSPGEQ
jgi:hypothetical protein